MPTMKAIFITLLMTTFVQFANAIPITNTVVIGDKEWAQVDLFNGATWNSINAQCPLGVCGASSSFNSLSLNGWTWATQGNVGDFIFAPLTAHTGGVSASFEEPINNITPFIAATGFNLTLNSNFGAGTLFFSNQALFGLTSDAFGGVASATWDRVINSGSLISSRTRFTTNASIGGDLDLVAPNNGGAWFYRANASANTVPEPAALALLGLGLVGLGFRNKKQA